MERREFLLAAGAGLALGLGRIGKACAARRPGRSPGYAPWRKFEVVTDVQISPRDLPAKLWLPLPDYRDSDYQRTLDIQWSGNPSRAGVHRDPVYGAPVFYAEWKDDAAEPMLRTAAVVATRNRSVDIDRPGPLQPVPREEIELYLRSTAHIPTDGIVRATANRILPLAGQSTMDRALAIYQWVVENTYRDPKVKGCGTGDVRFMLESGSLGGKCADLNALFVALARSVGIPARGVYGVRVAESTTWRSLGQSGDITGAQHCRAEFFHPNFGWVPVDPADVRKVVLEEEKGNVLPLRDPRVDTARKVLFGAWEMNWIGFNSANDTRLAPRTGKPLNHFMYPHAETKRGVLDCYDPENFRYQMSAREVAA